VCLFFGLVAPYKGLEGLIQAFKSLPGDAAWLVIAGKAAQPEYGDRIEALAQHPRIRHHPGFVPDDRVQVYFNAADVVALPYEQVTTSSSVMLALTFGRPVVAPDLEVLAEVVPPEAGILYSPGQAGALADALRHAQTAHWSPTVLQAYARQFDWPVIGARLAALYRAALGEAGAGSILGVTS
jgi:glycosyltransferase involved in cell wall biosynthesis